ncbi:hypothetical protein [Tenacibaculum finnmarkense]|uniref:hypothetical protein n=1 Tax=Tenacibaculum finnmarkense TaxID=2781243 RepID=UPI00187B9273|nr:hypothetical protein [Tenacibaculum finnmarkense]MBE7635190.1 hypothetical protein [Tenacibaculum finnmarkense genomovar ulcerans]MBE7646711.1 hypothetical protein [Tenacibaculum finnmarkense genomovar ulcerans]MBE7689030.1 hypothetical protein [Tenacibaculum finnmarkense genomovar ulcerans]MCD8401440.1 hypothetical protein [Tenacibaculum finnmarkense genomovar ulcerans]MCD8423582.1 hypothetical protein [Tenacibaculum finnmarkense genomovar ulcerans]
MKIKFLFLVIFHCIVVIAFSQNESNTIIKNIETIITHKNIEGVIYHTYEEYNTNGQLTKQYYITKDYNKKHRLMYEYQYSNKLIKKIINYQNQDEPLSIEYFHKDGKLIKNAYRFFKNEKEILKNKATNYTDYTYDKDTIIGKTYHYNKDKNKYLLFKITKEVLDNNKNIIQEKHIFEDGNYSINTYKYDQDNRLVSETTPSAEYHYKYNKKRNLLEEFQKTDSYSNSTKFSYTYDKNGNWIERLKFTDINYDKKSTLTSKTKRIIKYY